jgi:hypothetical protein
MLLLVVLVSLSLAAPPVLPMAFNTTFTMTLPGAKLDLTHNSPAFWAYDANQGGQVVWHPACPLGGATGCSFMFTGGYANPVIFSIGSSLFGSRPQSCCVLAAGVPILPPTTFSKYAPVINTTILHANRNVALAVEMFFSENRQCYVDAAGNLARILDVDLTWDMPVMAQW